MTDKPTPIALGPLAFARWLWRQLTSMRTALILLLLLAIAAIPGSLIPQDVVDPNKSAIWRAAHPDLTPIYRKLDLFNVYGAPWFAAIYVLLMVSLVGCIIPRTLVYARGLRAQPPRTPKNLGRFADSAAFVTDESPEVVLDRAAVRLRRSRLRRDDPSSISAERGYLREAGNLLFHISVIIVLVGFAAGQLFGFKGAVQVLVGKDPQGVPYGYSNELTQIDDHTNGSLWDSSMLDPFKLNVDTFTMDWSRGALGGNFESKGTYTLRGQQPVPFDLKVNHPLTIGSTDVFLIGHGYAPIITWTDPKGHKVTNPTAFLPIDQANFQSVGAVLFRYAAPTPFGLDCTFLPVIAANQISSASGDLTAGGLIKRGDGAVLSCFVYTGNLGASTAYSLDPTYAKKITGKDGRAFNISLKPTLDLGGGSVMHNSITLPDNLGTLSFDGIAEWNRLQISQQPGREVALGGVVLALLGMMGSLFIRPRRVWVRATPTAGGTLVEIAALDRSGGGDTEAYVTHLMKELQDV